MGLTGPGFVLHNFNRYDLMLLNRGRWILDALERFPVPVPLTDDDLDPSVNPPGPNPDAPSESP